MKDGSVQMTITGHLAKRSWIEEHEELVEYLQNFSIFDEIGFKLWEHPFIFKEVMKRPHSRILDIGMGHGSISWVLSRHGHQVVGVDQYESCWEKLREIQAETGLKCVNGDARNLEMFQDAEFDIALLVSVIEHIPSNTIWCEKRHVWKTGKMLRQEMPEKMQVISEAVRVVRPGGLVIITSDIYPDYPPDMNISWRDMLGIEEMDRDILHDWPDLCFSGSSSHKGRVVSVGIMIEKNGDNAHQQILRRARDLKYAG